MGFMKTILPGASLQVLGKVVVDMKTGDVWGFPTLGADPYPIDITSRSRFQL